MSTQAYSPIYLPKGSDWEKLKLTVPKIRNGLLMLRDTSPLTPIMQEAAEIIEHPLITSRTFYEKLYEAIDSNCLLDLCYLLSAANYQLIYTNKKAQKLDRLNQHIMDALKCAGKIQYMRKVFEVNKLNDEIVNKIVELNNCIDEILKDLPPNSIDDIENIKEKKKRKVLIVGNTQESRCELKELLNSGLYGFIEAQTSTDAIKQLDKNYNEVVLVLVEYQIPTAYCFELLTIMHTNGWSRDIPVVVVSTEDGEQHVPSMYETDITAFINKPYDPENVRGQLSKIIRLGSDTRKEDTDMAFEMVRHDKNNDLMIGILGGVIESKNGELGDHVSNVSKISRLLLDELNKENNMDFSQEYISLVGEAAALHDIGKICIPSEILNKPGKLTKGEFALMQEHTIKGYEMLEDLPYNNDIVLIKIAKKIVRYHHERWDGGGYPEGLAGDNIPIEAQVVAIADVYDALTAERCYKHALPHDDAISMILDGECGKFNPRLLDILEKNEKQIELIKRQNDDLRYFLDDEINIISRTLDRMSSVMRLPEKRRERLRLDLFERVMQSWDPDIREAYEAVQELNKLKGETASPSLFRLVRL